MLLRTFMQVDIPLRCFLDRFNDIEGAELQIIDSIVNVLKLFKFVLKSVYQSINQSIILAFRMNHYVTVVRPETQYRETQYSYNHNE